MYELELWTQAQQSLAYILFRTMSRRLPYIWIKIAVPLPFEELLISLGNAVIKISATNVIAPSNRKY